MSTGDCGCWTGAWWGVTPPPRCAMHGGANNNVAGGVAGTYTLGGNTTTTFSGYNHVPPHIPDADIERIAQRVAELLKESK